jgi:hypothetical protein
VGDSITNGTSNQTVWAGIHHKTNLSGGKDRHGWPDDTYFDRVVSECAAVGVYTPQAQAQIAAQKQQLHQQKAQQGGAAASNAPSAPPALGASPAARRTRSQSQGVDDLKAQIDALTAQLQQAMRDRNTAEIRRLMAERNVLNQQLQAKSG